MYNCPACGEAADLGRDTCLCGGDLSLLRAVDRLPDAWFNQGLAAQSHGDTGEALQWLAACCVARPTDAQAWRALARAWAQLGHPVEARAAVQRAAAIEPQCGEHEDILQAVEELNVR